jgi:hypothetical protein
MKTTDLDRDAARRLVTETVTDPTFRRATFGGAIRGGGGSAWVRVVVRPIDLRGQPHLQFSYFDRTKCVTRNVLIRDAGLPLDEVLVLGFAGVHLSTQADEIDLRTSKKGKIHVGRRPAALEADEPARTHNRAKDVPLPEGRADRLLEALGILTADGQVRPTMRAKYTQINEFLKHLLHLLDDAGLRGLGRPVEILDCGCGSSYLTLAAHHYLNHVLDIPARITGVDVNDEVIRKSLQTADRAGAEGLAFACGQIGSIQAKPDVVLALHACDTATDDAIAQAVRGAARLLLSVPCCHHHLNQAIRPDGPAGVLRPILRHGILHQRTADLITDAFRALALRIMGYRTDVVEFVSPEHTARNLMIRAVRTAPAGEAAFVAEYRDLCRFWQVTPYIELALGEKFQTFLSQGDAS